MALKVKLTKAEFESLAATLKEFYVERDGAYVLDAEGMEDTGTLRSTLEKERKAAKDANRLANELKDKIGDMDVDVAKAAVAKLRELEEKGLLAEGKIEEVIKARTDAMKADHANQVKGFQTELSKRDEQIAKVTKNFKDLRIKSDLTPLALKRGVRPEALPDVIARMTMTGVKGIRWDWKDDDVVALAGDGIKYGKDPSKPMSFEEGLELLAADAPHLFGENTGGNANPSAGSRQAGSQFVISAADARDTQRYQMARSAAEKAGQTLVIQQ